MAHCIRKTPQPTCGNEPFPALKSVGRAGSGVASSQLNRENGVATASDTCAAGVVAIYVCNKLA